MESRRKTGIDSAFDPSGKNSLRSPAACALSCVCVCVCVRARCLPFTGRRHLTRKLDCDSRGCGSALHTIIDNAQRARQWAGGCGIAAPGDILDTPPYRYRLGHQAE